MTTSPLTTEEREDLVRMLRAAELLAAAGPLGPVTLSEAAAYGWTADEVAEMNEAWSAEQAEETAAACRLRFSLLKKLCDLSGTVVDQRDPSCVERWPECSSGEYDPRCCRFPKSCSAGEYQPPPTWLQVGDTLWAGEFWYIDSRAWAAWHALVAQQIGERGAWFIVGWTTNAERLVIDVLHPHTLPELLRTRNIRGVEFWRGQS